MSFQTNPKFKIKTKGFFFFFVKRIQLMQKRRGIQLVMSSVFNKLTGKHHIVRGASRVYGKVL